MAEQEVIKHTKKVIQTAGDHEKGWKHKLKEIILEVLIIVFAVTLSISLHNWSEKRHDRHEEHAFLEGLRKDLKNDIVEMQDDSIAYQRVAKGTHGAPPSETSNGPCHISQRNEKPSQ